MGGAHASPGQAGSGHGRSGLRGDAARPMSGRASRRAPRSPPPARTSSPTSDALLLAADAAPGAVVPIRERVEPVRALVLTDHQLGPVHSVGDLLLSHAVTRRISPVRASAKATT